MKLLKLTLSILLGLVALLGLLPWSALATNLLTNSGFNDPFVDIPGRVWNGRNETIATGWVPFYIESQTHQGDEGAGRLHWFSSKQFADAFNGLDYHIEGNRAQNIWSAYKFEAGVYQQLPVSPGQAYGFDIGLVTFWRGPGFPDSDGLMVKQVGIDPTGGTDPTSSAVVWSEPDANDKAWVYMDIAAVAQAVTMTVFAKIQAPENDSVNHTDLNMVYFEAAHVAPVPATMLGISTDGAMVNLSWSGSSPAAEWSLKGYEVQYRDQANDDWTTLQSKTGTSTSGSFTGEAGHTYVVRARTWQKRSESYNDDIDLPGVWQERTVTLGGGVQGRVTTNREEGISGVTVAESSGLVSTTTDNLGNYGLTLTNAGDYTFTTGTAADWTAPPGAPASVTLTSTTYLSFTLRPPDDMIRNGDFEDSLADWQISGSAPVTFSQGHRSGSFSLRLTDTVALSQTGSISGSYQPILSFWYKVVDGDGNDVFTAELLGTSELTAVNRFTTSTAGEWQHAWLPLDLAEVYTGAIGARFSLSQTDPTQTVVYLDEVSLGSSWGGPNSVYLPVVLRQSQEN